MSTTELRLTALEQEVADLKAQQALRTLLSRYAVAVDDHQPELLRTLFTPDCIVEIPAWNVARRGLADVIDFYHDYWRRFASPRRYFANEDFAVSGDTATCFMYWHVTQEHRGEPWLGWGTYAWRFARDGNQWRISSVLIDIRAMTTLARGWAGENKFAPE